mgnify:CR=1 FL=1
MSVMEIEQRLENELKVKEREELANEVVEFLRQEREGKLQRELKEEPHVLGFPP